jgi:uncharacterized protein (DUF58 family)
VSVRPAARDTPPGGGEPLFDTVFLRKLERLELLARKLFRGHLRGERTATRRGRGLEFADFRRYRPGDDLRHVDWNIFSRLDRLFLKLYASEEDLTLHLLLDSSASMGFGEASKFDHARRLAAALAYIGLHNLDRVGVAAFADGPGAALPPVKARHHFMSVLAFLDTLACRGETHLGGSLRAFAGRVRHPGLVVVVSDLAAVEDLGTGLDALRRRAHDVVLLQVLAEEEIDPPLEGSLRLEDAELGATLDVTADDALRAAYRRRLAAHLAQVESDCRRRAVGYLRASTAIPFEDVVLRYLREGALVG